jgi:hypothetical protein
MSQDPTQQRELFFQQFVENAVEEQPDGSSRCNINLVVELAQTFPKGAQLSMQECWRSFLDEPSGPFSAGSRLFSIWIGVGYILAHGKQEEFFRFLDNPVCCPGLTKEIKKALAGM